MTVRPMQAADGSAWQAIHTSVAEEGLWVGEEAPVAERAAAMVERFVGRDDGMLFLAEVDDQAVGYLHVELDAGVAEIGMAILVGFRRRGLGTALMEAAIDWARSRGADRIHLDVFPHNDAAIALYARLGFVETARHREAWPRRNGDRWDLIAMELALA